MQIDERRIERRVRRYELPLIIGVVVTWMTLWREISPLSLLSGVFVSMLVIAVFYLPPVEIAWRFNVWYALRYVVYFIAQVALASVQVAWLAIRPQPVPKVAIIAIELRTQSDFILTMTGLTISLIPGSFIVDVDRDARILYLHVLNTPDERALEAMRREVAHIEALLIRALGSREELSLL